MADTRISKETFANQMIALARTIIKAGDDIASIDAAFSVHGFNSGGSDAFVDGDFSTNNKHLTAAIVDDTMFAIGTLHANLLPLLDGIRKCIPGGLP